MLTHLLPATTRVIHCDLCGSASGELLASHDRYGFAIPFIKCTCGLYRMGERPADLFAFYNHGTYRDLVSAYHGRRIDATTIQTEQIEYAEDLEAFLCPRVFDKVMDVGGSTGVVSRYLAALWKGTVTIIDPAGDEIKHARGCERICGTAETFNPKFRRWDIALVCQTIEHLESPRTVLTNLRSCCESLFIDVVDVAQFESPRRAAKLDHTWGFDDNAVRKMLAVCGWKVISSQRRASHIGYLCSHE